MTLQATINLDGQELIGFLQEHRIRVRYIPDPNGSDDPVFSIAEHSTDTGRSPKGFVDHVEGLARELNHEIARLEGLGMMKYQEKTINQLRLTISELMVVSSIALKEVHGVKEAGHVPLDR